MPFTSESSPSYARSRTRIISTNIYMHTLTLIFSLLLTLMLLWHISTITLIENYDMPKWWEKVFLDEHTKGWKIGIWVGVGLLVPVNALHALLCLDWWCAVLYGRGRVEDRLVKRNGRLKGKKISEVGGHEDLCHTRRQHQDHEANTSTISRPSSQASSSALSAVVSTSNGRPHSYHPLLRPYLSSTTQLVTLTIYDILIILVLAAHVTSYFTSLPTAMTFCNTDAVLEYPDWAFGSTNIPFSMRDRCIGLNVNIHVAGGFAIFVAIVLGLLHLVVLAIRVCELINVGRKGVVGKGCGDRDAHNMLGHTLASTSTVASSGRTSSAPCPTSSDTSVAYTDNTTSANESRIATLISAEERSTDIRCVDWSTECAEQVARRRVDRTDDSDASKGDAKWSEALLECLVP